MVISVTIQSVMCVTLNTLPKSNLPWMAIKILQSLDAFFTFSLHHYFSRPQTGGRTRDRTNAAAAVRVFVTIRDNTHQSLPRHVLFQGKQRTCLKCAEAGVAVL